MVCRGHCGGAPLCSPSAYFGPGSGPDFPNRVAHRALLAENDALIWRSSQPAQHTPICTLASL